MNADKVNAFLTQYAKCFDPLRLDEIGNAMLEADDSAYTKLLAVPPKKPSSMFLAACTVGLVGGDRFMLGQTTMGFLKLILNFATCGIWYLGDLFTIAKRTKEYNYNMVMSILN